MLATHVLHLLHATCYMHASLLFMVQVQVQMTDVSGARHDKRQIICTYISTYTAKAKTKALQGPQTAQPDTRHRASAPAPGQQPVVLSLVPSSHHDHDREQDQWVCSLLFVSCRESSQITISALEPVATVIISVFVSIDIEIEYYDLHDSRLKIFLHAALQIISCMTCEKEK